MNLRDLRYLVAVADHRHFGRAAAACYVSQPTLSTQLKKLERELGVELVERNPRQVLLTAAGRQVVERARAILRDAEDIERVARAAADPEAGSLRLGLIPTVAPYLLPHVVPALHERFPRLELLLAEVKTDDILARLAAGDLDAGVLALPVPADGLRVEPLYDEAFLLAAPADRPLAHGDGPLPTDVLAGEHVLLLEEGHCLRDQALAVCQLAGADEHGGFRATSMETLRQMVAAGVGVTLLPALAVHPPVPVSGDVIVRPFEEPAPRRTVAVVWRRSSPDGPLLERLAGELRARAAALECPGLRAPTSGPDAAPRSLGNLGSDPSEEEP